MTKRTRSAVRLLALGGIAAAALAGCSAGSTDGGSDGTVTLTIGDRPSADRPEDRKYFDERVAAFEEANPDIDLEPSETVWEASTFQALAGGGSLPDVLSVPLTEPQGLIERGQAADITDALEAEGLLDTLNPDILKLAQDAEGRTYAVPTNAYSFGLVYNRALFEQAGLDPDNPPATWDEVRTAAKAITDQTDAAGWGQLSTSNTGGWTFTGMTYSFGGTVQSPDGSEATFDDEPAQSALELLHAMRWEDGSVAENALYDINARSQDFAAGKIGMMLGASDTYYSVVQNLKFPAEDFGVGGMPQDGGVNGTLSGGTVQIVTPDASEEEKRAAVKWISFVALERYIDEDTAVADAKASNEAGSVTGLPGLPVVNSEEYATYFEWIADYINVPTENFAPYQEASKEIPIMPEPVNNAQETYGALDTIIQTVLTDEGVDIPALLTKAQEDVTARLGR